MASSSKPTGVHYALIVFVLISIALGVCLLLAYKGSGSIGELKALNDNLNKKNAEADTALKRQYDNLTAIKKKLGSEFEEVGDDDTKPNTVLNDMELHIRNFGGGVAQKTYNETMLKLAEALRNAEKARDDLQAKLAEELALFEQRKNELNSSLAAEKSARGAADKGKIDADTTHAQELARKEADISDLRRTLDVARQDLAELKDATDKRIKAGDQRIANLLAINRKVTEELEQVKRFTFERPDGQVVTIDGGSKRVWIDLGSDDGLRERTTFSVYRRTNTGVGRASAPHAASPEDMKGKIEVTRVLEPHLSEARIVESDAFDPIGRGDPIYSPIWSPGRGEAFSVVGEIDLDGDGKSDRELFRELVTATGATIDNEVKDDGTLLVDGKIEVEPAISERTKFLVKGRIPDLTESADKGEQAIVETIRKLNKELDSQARERGVRIVSLSDFLSFIGYKPQRRLFVPGDMKYNIKDGTRAPSVDKASKMRSSTGNVSGAYSGERSTKTGKQLHKPQAN